MNGINRTILECKDDWPFNTTRTVNGINRTILECKETFQSEFEKITALSINRTILECKGELKCKS